MVERGRGSCRTINGANNCLGMGVLVAVSSGITRSRSAPCIDRTQSAASLACVGVADRSVGRGRRPVTRVRTTLDLQGKVRPRGLEPPRDYLPLGPQPSASASSATAALVLDCLQQAKVSQNHYRRQRPMGQAMPIDRSPVTPSLLDARIWSRMSKSSSAPMGGRSV